MTFSLWCKIIPFMFPGADWVKGLKIRKQRDDWPCFLKNIARSYHVAVSSLWGHPSHGSPSQAGDLEMVLSLGSHTPT